MHPPPANPLMPPNRLASTWMMAARVAGSYAVLGSLWVILSDVLVALPGASLDWRQTAKGLAFVWVTAAFLIMLVRRTLRALQEAESLRWAGEPQFRSLV